MCDSFPASVSPSLHITRTTAGILTFLQTLPYPEFAIEVEGIQQLDDVMVVARGQNVNLHHVILQLIFCFCVDNLGSSESPVLFVLSLKANLMTKGGNECFFFINSEYSAKHTLTLV